MSGRPNGCGLRIAYVGPFSFPGSAANALRVSGMTQALLHAGASVTIGAGSHTKPTSVIIDRRFPVDVVGLGELPNLGSVRLTAGWRGLLMGSRTSAWINSLSPAPDIAIVYGAHLGYLARLLRRARRPMLVIPDVVEWYDSSHLPGGRLGPYAASNAVSMRWIAPRARHVITISHFLEAYFSGHGCHTLRVPPLFSVDSNDALAQSPLSAQDGRLHLCYAGSPGAKDRTTIENLLTLGTKRRRADDLRVHLVGATREDFESTAGQLDLTASPWESQTIVVHGRVPHEDARRIVASCDYSVLQRPRRRYTEAGFPSKVAESLSVGTPVLANLTSDLGEILQDSVNSTVLIDDSSEALERAVCRILKTRLHSHFDRTSIRAEAARMFDPRAHSERIVDFLIEARELAA